MKRRYLGSWALPSGNSADVYWSTGGGVFCLWDVPPPAWPAADLEEHVTFPAILCAVAEVTGRRVLGVSA
jgi:hypothetical protein